MKGFRRRISRDYITLLRLLLHKGKRSFLPSSNILSSTLTLITRNILLAGSNPNGQVVNGTEFATFVCFTTFFVILFLTISASEFRVEYLNPPFMSAQRPIIFNIPSKIGYNKLFKVDVSIPKSLKTNPIKGAYILPYQPIHALFNILRPVALMDLGYSSHAFHSSMRLVFMEAHLSPDRKSLTVLSPPNNRVYPPGPAYVFLTVDGVTSTGVHVMVGSGATPPVADQGIRI